MNQRKLFGALSILLLAILFIAVGCGDGKRTARAGVNKRVPYKKMPPPPAPNSPEAKARSANMTQAEQYFNQATAGERLDKLPEGELTLTESVSHFRYMNTQRGEELRYIRQSQINSQGQLIPGQQSGAGLTGQGTPDQKGRTLVLPLKMTVKQGLADRATAQSLAFTNKLSQSPKDMTKLEMIDDLSQSMNSAADITVLDLLAQPATATADGGRSMRLANGKLASAWILKTADGKIAVHVHIEEGAQAGQPNNTSKQASVAMSRNLIFFYALKATEVASTATGQVGAQPQQPPRQEQPREIPAQQQGQGQQGQVQGTQGNVGDDTEARIPNPNGADEREQHGREDQP